MSRPGLRRIDNKLINMEKEPEAFRKIGIDVESVCYYDDTDVTPKPLSAVLLNVFFKLPRGENLTSASIPLVVESKPAQEGPSREPSVAESPSTGRPAGGPDSPTKTLGNYPSDRENPSVEIFGSYPSSDEYVRVPNRLKASEDFSGRRPQETLIISLSPQRRKLDGPTTLSWVFQGQKGALFPNNIRLLVIVCGPEEQERDPNGRIRPFMFRICLQEDLHISVYKTRLGRTRLGFMRRCLPDFYLEDEDDELKHEGWYFDIQGPYNPKIAEDALKGAKEGQTVGMVAALSSARTEFSR